MMILFSCLLSPVRYIAAHVDKTLTMHVMINLTKELSIRRDKRVGMIDERMVTQTIGNKALRKNIDKGNCNNHRVMSIQAMLTQIYTNI